MNLNEILVKPLITEKNTMLSALNKYTFQVDRRANKNQIKDAVEKIFNVKVTTVNVVNVPSKTRRVGRSVGQTTPWRKAVVTVAPGQRIEIFEGV